MSGYAETAIDAGARIIGACCGSVPDHIRQIRQVVDSYIPSGEEITIEVVENRLGAVSRRRDKDEGRSRRSSRRSQGLLATTHRAVAIPSCRHSNRSSDLLG